MVDGETDGDGLLPNALLADPSKQRMGAKTQAPATFGDGHDPGSEEISSLELGEIAGVSPNDTGSNGSLGLIVRWGSPGVPRKRHSRGS